jgi:hypothetical protein
LRKDYEAAVNKENELSSIIVNLKNELSNTAAKIKQSAISEVHNKESSSPSNCEKNAWRSL